MGLITKTTSNFNERRFLVRSLVAIFVIQFLSTGAQFANCFRLTQGSGDAEKAALICGQANASFSETGKLALTTLLALLVPAAAAGSMIPVETPVRKRKSTDEPEAP
jgi:hypothetical protein